ncbi:hypothetical protein [Actinomyces sp. MRS3W]|uniref:hypothetical protein n=1 Tax=Actinomyces sp. MRS3W TaxID=2800796 RepID=UPI0028FD7F98|nr:hypothetical protein [Actinomyces sp. MRS3W]MDU0347475.1 hypothetical protein [Actinomyces sp. MRS3W]
MSVPPSSTHSQPDDDPTAAVPQPSHVPVGSYPAMAAAVSPPPKKRSGPLIIGAVVGVIALVAAGTLVTMFLRSGRAGGTDSQRVSADWAKGSHRTWSLDIDADSYVRGNGSQLVVVGAADTSDRRTVTAYDLADGEPEEQWSTAVELYTDHFRFEYWGDYVVVGGSLLNQSDGGAFVAPWESWDSPEFLDTYAYLCESDGTCTAWSASDPNTALWEIVIDDSGEIIIDQPAAYPDPGRVYQDDNVTYVRVSTSTAVNVATGDIIDFELGDEENVFALTDGWGKIDYDAQRYTVLSPTGVEINSFEISNEARDAPGAAYMFDSPHVTAKQMQILGVNGDISWARVQVRTDEDADSGCMQAFLVDGTELTATQEDWSCSFDYSPHFIISGDDSLIMLTDSSPMQTASALSLRGMWTIADGELISPLEGYEFGEDQFYLFSSELIVAYSPDNGHMTGYAPGAE